MTQTNQFQTVLSLSPYNNQYYLADDTQLTPQRTPQFGKSQFVISYLGTNDFITALINVSKNIPDEDLDFVIETKVYEELALDMAVEYTIKYVEAFLSGEQKERAFHVFVVDPLIIEEKFAESIERVQYIDQIVPVPLLIQTLFNAEIIQGNDAQCFIYFQDNDAFFTLYNNQQFVYTKSLKYSFREMHERFCELLGEQLDFDDFVTLLADEGLGTPNPEYQKYLIKLFGELFLHINDVLTFAKRAYELESIEEIYIGTQVGSIDGLDEYCQTYLGFEAQPFDFNYGYSSESYVDQIQQLMQLYAVTSAEERYDINLSVFHRPPAFFQRHSGKLILVAVGSLTGAFAYPVINWTSAYVEDVATNVLQQQYETAHAEKVQREKAINLKTKEKEQSEQMLEDETNLFNDRQATLDKIQEIKVHYPMKAKHITNLTKDLNRFNVGASSIFYSEDNITKTFTMHLIANKDRELTDLIKYLTDKRKKDYFFNTKTITLDPVTSKYLCVLKAVIK